MDRRVFYFLILSYFLLFSCSEKESLLPYKPVYLELDLTFRDKILQGDLGYKTFIKEGSDYIAGKEVAGYGGVLAIKTILNGICAFDLSCPNEGMPNTRVEVDDLGLNAICPSCGTKYEVGESGTGGAMNAKKLRLTRYNVTSRGNNKYIVSN